MTTVRFELPPFDIDNDGSAESIVFELSDNLTLNFRIRTDFLVDGSGSTVIDILGDLVEDISDTDLDTSRKGVFTDLGGGARVIEVTGQVVTGDDHQWGTGNGGKWDATGGTALQKAQLFNEVLRKAEIDSRDSDSAYPQGHLATLEVGEFSPNGKFSPIGASPNDGVVPEQPQATFDAERDSSTATIDINFVSAASLSIPKDASSQSDA